MAKRPDKHDATMPLSESQVVSVNAPKPPDHGIPQNDRSVWKGMVMGADEFAPAPAKKKGSRAKLWIAAGVIVAGGAGVGAYEFTRGSSTAPAASTTGSAAPGSGSAAPMSAAPAIDAMAAPPDAAPPDAAPPDAAVADAAVADAATPDAGTGSAAHPTKAAVPAKKKLTPAKKKPVPTKKKLH